jgi:CelD/BcsL family acetyltransferase involved in cellulose biosynthesis
LNGVVGSRPIGVETLTAGTIDPIRDPRWVDFIADHPSAVAFHLPGWIESTVSVFGYQPRFHVLETDEGHIVAAWPSMLIKSRLTGTRLVCLPFCHRSGPLLETDRQAEQLLAALAADMARFKAASFEVRDWPTTIGVPAIMTASDEYTRHVIDLSDGPDGVLRAMDKDMRYSLNRSRREGVTVRLAESDADVETFYRLYVSQRRRQGLLPQPESFLRSIHERVVCRGNGFLVIAERGGKPLCALLSVGHGDTVIGTHSAATVAARSYRATPLAIWRSIELACEQEYRSYDLGRSDAESTGLVHFKKEWGAQQQPLPYYFHPQPTGVNAGGTGGLKKSLLRAYARFAPDPVFVGLSRPIYRHLG